MNNYTYTNDILTYGYIVGEKNVQVKMHNGLMHFAREKKFDHNLKSNFANNQWYKSLLIHVLKVVE